MLEWPEFEVWCDSLEDAGIETLGLRLGLFISKKDFGRHPGFYDRGGGWNLYHREGYGGGDGEYHHEDLAPGEFGGETDNGDGLHIYL